MVMNYTGDALHFGLAAEQYRSKGVVGDVRVLMVGDDVAVGKEQGSIVGRVNQWDAEGMDSQRVGRNDISVQDRFGSLGPGCGFGRCREDSKVYHE